MVLGFGISLAGLSQPTNVDSLVNQLDRMANDTSKVRALIHIAYKLETQQRSGKSANQYANQALNLAKSLGDTVGIAASHYRMGYQYRFISPNPDSAIYNFELATAYFKQLNHLSRYVSCLTHLSSLYKVEYKLQTALEYAFMAKDVQDNHPGFADNGFPHEIIGSIYGQKEDYEKAEKYYLEALQRYEASNNIYNIVQLHTSLAYNYNRKNDHRRALSFAKHALELAGEHKIWASEVYTHYTIGSTYSLLNVYDSSLYHFGEAERLLRKHVGESWDVVDGFIDAGLGEVYAKMENYALAEYYFLRSINRVPKEIGKIFTWESGIELARLYYKMRRYDKSAYYFEQYVDYRDSVNHLQNLTSIQDIETRYEAAKTEKENVELKAELMIQQARSRNQRLQLILAVVVAVTAAIIFATQYRSQRVIKRKNKLLTEQNLEIQVQNEEIVSQHEEISSQAELLRVKSDFLEKQNLKLEEINREKDGLMSVVAHDLRAPLNRTKGLAGLMKTRPLPSEDKVFVEKIMQVANEGLSLIKDILEVNRLEYDKLVSDELSIQLDKFIEEEVIQPALEAAQRKNIAITNVMDHNLWVTVDATSLKRMLENILSNAIKFSPPSSKILVRATTLGGTVYIGIQDDGPGISQEDQKKMFRKFQRLSARPTGGENSTGLGLAIVKSLADKINAEIQVESNLDAGTEFIILLGKNSHNDDSVA